MTTQDHCCALFEVFKHFLSYFFTKKIVAGKFLHYTHSEDYKMGKMARKKLNDYLVTVAGLESENK